jgi:hypothetical protein
MELAMWTREVRERAESLWKQHPKRLEPVRATMTELQTGQEAAKRGRDSN